MNAVRIAYAPVMLWNFDAGNNDQEAAKEVQAMLQLFEEQWRPPMLPCSFSLPGELSIVLTRERTVNHTSRRTD
jgi:hypothetical protein